MRISNLILTAIAVLAVTTIANAGIIDHSCAADGDGAIVMTYIDELAYNSSLNEYTLGMDGKQYGYPAHIGGDFTTDTEQDPTVWIVEGVDNYTNFAWTDYHITIGMNKTFSIGGVVTPLGWTAVVTAPVIGTIPNGGGPGWVGTVDYYYGGSGTEIAIGNSGDFGLKVSFLGSVAFNTEQIPTPEPATLSILGLGGMALLRKRSK